jgi:hypothetical protein
MNKSILTLLTILLIATATTAQIYTPVAVTGFNADGIAEDTMAITHSSRALDGSDYVLYSYHYGTILGSNQGLPDNDTVASIDAIYQLQPYSQNNLLYLDNGVTDSLVLVTPTNFASLDILAMSTEGAGTNNYTLRFTDGTIATFNGVALSDWFSGTNPVISGIDRAGRTTGTPDFNSSKPNLYANTLTLQCADQHKLVRSIVIANVGGHPRTCIFAVSGLAPATYSIVNTNPTCHGGQGRAVITGNDGFYPYTYAWSSTPVQHSDTATLTAGVYTVTASDNNNCSVVLYDTLTQPAGSNLTLTASTDSICSGTPVTLMCHGATSYTWSVGHSTDSTIVVTPAASTTYSVTGTISGSCAGAGAVSIFVKQSPTLGITATPSRSLCMGQSVTLTASGAVHYTWSGGVTNGAAITPTASTTYSVIGTDSAGCHNTDSISITVNPLPVVKAHSDTTICLTHDVILTGSGAASYLWSGGVTNGVAFIPTITRTYYVTGTDGHACTAVDSAKVSVSVCRGIATLTDDAAISVYPNPGHGHMTLTISTDSRDLKLCMTDIQGRTIYSAAYAQVSAGSLIQMDIAHSTAGIYILHITAEGLQQSRRIVIE